MSDDWAATHAGIIDDAVRYLKGRKTTGPGFIQRHVRVGWATACLLLEELERRCVVGSPNGAGRRNVLPPPPAEAAAPPPRFAVGDRVRIIASDHPWSGWTGEITGPFESASVPELRWRVAIDGGWSDAAVSESEIRKATP